jgi:hypothetical protein
LTSDEVRTRAGRGSFELAADEQVLAIIHAAFADCLDLPQPPNSDRDKIVAAMT